MLSRVAVSALLAGSVLVGAGCQPTECAGASGVDPYVAVNGSAWLAAHRGVSLRACVDARCLTLATGRRAGVRFQVAGGRSAVSLVVTGPAAGNATLDRSIHVQLHRHELSSGPCGTQYATFAHVRIAASGQLVTA